MYFIVPTFHSPGIPISGQPLTSVGGSVEARPPPADPLAGSQNNNVNGYLLPPPRDLVGHGGRAQHSQLNSIRDREHEAKASLKPHRGRVKTRRGGEDLAEPAALRANDDPIDLVQAALPDEGVASPRTAGSENDVMADSGPKVKEAKNPERPWFFASGSKRPLPGERGRFI